MSNRNCTCDSHTLLWKGCQCSFNKPRTIAINFSIPGVGWKKAWRIIDTALWKAPNIKVKSPTCDDDVLHIMWEIERISPDLYDSIARDLEEEFRYPRGKPVDEPLFKIRNEDGWGF